VLTRRFAAFAALATACALPFALEACSSSDRPTFDPDDASSGSDSAIVAPPQDSGNSISSGGSSGAVKQHGPAEVFVQSKDTLYKLDPDTKALTKVGKFSGVSGSVVDIALNADGEMYGTTTDALYKIDKTTGASTKVGTGGTGKYPNSLSFAPVGTVESDREVLVGYLDSAYISIDPTTGATDVIRPNALGEGLVSSGDIVSITEGDFLTYLTVKPLDPNDCTGECAKCKDNDCLYEVDPATGEKISNLGTTNRTAVFGLAFWAGTLYGISSDGKLFQIDPGANPLSSGVKNITIPGGLGTIAFFGAGSTTSAPSGPN
jgi:hypothetical protein